MPQKPGATPSPGQPRTLRCAHCGRTYQFTTLAAHKTFPFCSARCREADLGNWLSGSYVVPGEPLPPQQEEEDSSEG